MQKLVYQHVEKDGKFFETANYFHFPLRRLRSGCLPELPPSVPCHAHCFSTFYLVIARARSCALPHRRPLAGREQIYHWRRS